MAFLTLTSEVSQPFVIANLSPVSQPSSRKNSDAAAHEIDDIDRLLSSGALQGSAIIDTDAADKNAQHTRKASLSLL